MYHLGLFLKNYKLVIVGGDDCKFKCFDRRIQFEKPVFENKEHNQGVTTCSSNKIRNFVISTGRQVWLYNILLFFS